MATNKESVIVKAWQKGWKSTKACDDETCDHPRHPVIEDQKNENFCSEITRKYARESICPVCTLRVRFKKLENALELWSQKHDRTQSGYNAAKANLENEIIALEKLVELESQWDKQHPGHPEKLWFGAGDALKFVTTNKFHKIRTQYVRRPKKLDSDDYVEWKELKADEKLPLVDTEVSLDPPVFVPAPKVREDFGTKAPPNHNHTDEDANANPTTHQQMSRRPIKRKKPAKHPAKNRMVRKPIVFKEPGPSILVTSKSRAKKNPPAKKNMSVHFDESIVEPSSRSKPFYSRYSKNYKPGRYACPDEAGWEDTSFHLLPLESIDWADDFQDFDPLSALAIHRQLTMAGESDLKSESMPISDSVRGLVCYSSKLRGLDMKPYWSAN